MSIPAAYLGVILIWSTTPLAIKWSGQESILFGVTGRMMIGALLCLLLIKLFRVDFPWHRVARRSYWAASVAIYGSMMTTYWSAQFISSGLISVIFGLAPIITSVLALIWLKEQPLTWSKWLGMALGLGGLMLIFNHQLHLGVNEVKGLGLLLIAVLLHSISAVWIKQVNISLSPLAVTCGGLLISLPLYALTWIVTGASLPSVWPMRMVLSTLYLGTFGSVVGFVLYYYLLKHVAVPKVSLISLITPITALFLGQTLNGETVSLSIWIGTMVVLSGLALYQWGDSLWALWGSKSLQQAVHETPST